jgi:hypothetical protein
MTSVADALLLLEGRVREVLGERGLDLLQLTFAADAEQRGRVQIQLVATVADGEPPDDGFDEVIASAALAEAEQRAQETVAELAERLRQGKGFLRFE